MRFKDIVLDEKDLEEIEAKVEAHNREVYQGQMTARQKGILRDTLKREVKEGIWAMRDYLDADAGEPPKGARW